MAGISAKSLYGLSALLHLVKQNENQLIQIKDIASSANIPQGYLEQILPALKNFGFVESIRGANGGYRLAKSPNEIILHDIISALEGGVCEASLQGASQGFGAFLLQLNSEVKSLFAKNLVEISEFIQKSEEDFVYHI